MPAAVGALRHASATLRWRLHLDTCPYDSGRRGAAGALGAPRVQADRGAVEREPLAVHGALFEALVVDWLREATISAVALQMGRAGMRSIAPCSARCNTAYSVVTCRCNASVWMRPRFRSVTST